jgi:hypothetical protein
MGLASDLEGYERRLRSSEQELERERAFSNEFAFKVIVLSSEIERLNQEGAVTSKSKSREFLELQENYSRLQSKVQTKNSEIDLLVSRIATLEHTYPLPHPASPSWPTTSATFWPKSHAASRKPGGSRARSRSTRTTPGASTSWGPRSTGYAARTGPWTRTLRRCG